MRFFRSFPELRGHSRGNPRSGLIFMVGGGVTYIVCARYRQQCWNLYPYYQPILNTESSQVSRVCTRAGQRGE